MLKPKVSSGNTKLGKIPNISLPPGLSCVDDAPCSKLCYAKKAWRCYPNVREAWGHNLELYKNNADAYFGGIAEFLNNENPPYFRFHVGGDIPTEDYLVRMIKLATKTNSRLLAYTKRLKWLSNLELPNNLVLRPSFWVGWGEPQKFSGWPKAWYQTPEGDETRIPDKFFECQGTCRNCKVCWSKQVKDVVFMKH